MRELVNLTGMVLKASPVGDNDRRLVLLTRERGKITAFARGAKRPGSQLMGVTRPFVFGNFRLYEGRDACNLQGADVLNYFAEITLDMEATCYGFIFWSLPIITDGKIWKRRSCFCCCTSLCGRY